MDRPQTRTRLSDPAPNFNRADTYPSAGAMIGPAWQAMWSRLKPTAWTPLLELVEVAGRYGVHPQTARGLAAGARRAGHVEVEYRIAGGTRQAFYRRTK